MDWTSLDWIGMDWNGLGWLGLEWTGSNQIGLDWTASDRKNGADGCLDILGGAQIAKPDTASPEAGAISGDDTRKEDASELNSGVAIGGRN